MEKLPIDIIENILNRLPVESRLQSKGVCNTWRNLIGKNKTGMLFAYINKSGKEIQLYYGDKYYELNLEQYYSVRTLTKLDHAKYTRHVRTGHYYYKMVGSCNGLVCLEWAPKATNSSCGGICNPVTGEFLFLPGIKQPPEIRWRAIGFGYLKSTNEYKVVRCSYKYLNRVLEGHAEVYTLGSQSGWQRKENFPYFFRGSGIFVNGAIHWLGENGRRPRRRVYTIAAYDLSDDKIKYVSPLPCKYSRKHDECQLKLLRGNLCAIHTRYNRDGDEIIDIWAFRKGTKDNTRKKLRPRVTREEYYDHNWSWSKEFSIPISRGSEKYKHNAIAITKSNKVVLWHADKKLYCYDNNTSTLTKVYDGDGNDDGLSCLQAIPHMNTLVSLKDLGEDCGNSANLDDGESLEYETNERKRRKC